MAYLSGKGFLMYSNYRLYRLRYHPLSIGMKPLKSKFQKQNITKPLTSRLWNRSDQAQNWFNPTLTPSRVITTPL